MDIQAIEARPSGEYLVTVADADSSTAVLFTAEGRMRGAAVSGVDATPLGQAVRMLHRARMMAGAW